MYKKILKHKELAVVMMAGPGRMAFSDMIVVIDETPDGWIWGYPYQDRSADTYGSWYGPTNIIQRNFTPPAKSKFDYNEIPPGTLVTVEIGKSTSSNPQKIFGLVVKRRGTTYEVTTGDTVKHFAWQIVRPFNATIDNTD